MLLFNVGERGHVIEKSRNTKNDTEEQKQDFYGIDEGIVITFSMFYAVADKTHSHSIA